MAVAVIAGAVSLGVAAVGLFSYKGEIKRLNAERRLERERSFERAQTGYRALYRKFAAHYEKAPSTEAEMDKVRRDFYEAQMVAFRPLNDALDQFWPRDQRVAGQPPSAQHWEAVAGAFLELAGLTLERWESRQKPRSPSAPAP